MNTAGTAKQKPEYCALCGEEESEENDVLLGRAPDGDLLCGACEDRTMPCNYCRCAPCQCDRIYDEARDREFDDYDHDERDW
jgi:hypothetical protein